MLRKEYVISRQDMAGELLMAASRSPIASKVGAKCTAMRSDLDPMSLAHAVHPCDSVCDSLVRRWSNDDVASALRVLRWACTGEYFLAKIWCKAYHPSSVSGGWAGLNPGFFMVPS